MLRAADIPILSGPQPGGNEVLFAPTWAVSLVQARREEHHRACKRLYTKDAVPLLKADPRYGPAPAALLARLDELRAFAVLRGWRYAHGCWKR